MVAPRVEQGAINLEAWDFAEWGTVPLAGDWEFYPSVFLEPEELHGIRGADPRFIVAPALWNVFDTGDGLMGPYGYGTYPNSLHKRYLHKVWFEDPGFCYIL